MKRLLMAVMVVAVAVAFTAPSFAEGKKKKKEEGKEGKIVQMINAEQPKEEGKKDTKKKK
jgi:type II secretory pathway pseudopilin PulG